MEKWFAGLPPEEQQRRQVFSDQFRADREAFRQHFLTPERDVTEHRLGYPNIEGKVVGPYGHVHIATPPHSKRRKPSIRGKRPCAAMGGNIAPRTCAAAIGPIHHPRKTPFS
jgi:hypothetical protein